MEGHPIPRQITTFEFKLIGFLTLRQFIYLLVFIPLGFVLYKLFPIPIINIVLAIIIGAVGPVMAFVPVNDRPIDVWIKNFIKRITSPTQYTYHKHNNPLYFLKNLYFVQDPHRVLSHVESQEKLAAYLTSTKKSASITNKTSKNSINTMLQSSSATLKGSLKQPQPPQTNPHTVSDAQPQPIDSQSPQQPIAPSQTTPKTPFFTGVVRNHKLIPLPGILIYVKGENGDVLRLLKSNPHGVFATFSPLSAGEYLFELKDPRGGYFFDTMKLPVEISNTKPYEFYSKELI